MNVDGREMVRFEWTSVSSCHVVKQSKGIIQDYLKIASFILMNSKKNHNGMLARGFKSRFDVSPRRKRRYPASAIMAALSMQSPMPGRYSAIPYLSACSFMRLLSELFAATPPATTILAT